jgi:divinyl chlorophyllide a 8-vinyl-reductase
VTYPAMHNKVLPIGGPGPAITPKQQGEKLFELLGRKPRFRRVPVAMMDSVIGVLSAAGRVSRRAQAKAEYARIGRYYATESMLVLDPESAAYSSDLTPEFGSETLFDHYAALLRP